MKNLIKYLIIALLIIPGKSYSDEGMWLPMFIEKLNYADMQGKGLKLTPEELYSVNKSSMKDAIVRLGGGFCTGEMISSQGLMLTNHHCGFSVIQENSTVEHDYLKNGFWAMSKEDELPAGFSVSYLQRMEDVSSRINSELTDDMDEATRAQVVSQLKKKIISEEKEKEGSLNYEVKGFFKNNEFYMLVYKEYTDVRLVGAPPSSIGKYGGDTDNWMWPRQTGDFSMFRVYADKDNKPSAFSKENVPYKPAHHLPISMKGVEEGDYAMIFGYPGSTDRYLTSYGVKLATELDQPARVKIRRKKLDLYEEGQAKSPKIRIQYASKHARVSNYWKYFIGQTRGLKRLKVYEKKKAQEDAFAKWVNENDDRKSKYGEVISLYEKSYKIFETGQLANTYTYEALFGIEATQLGFGFARLKGMYKKLEALKKEKADEKDIKELETAITGIIASLREGAKDHFKDYNSEIDQNVMAAMLKMYNEDLKDASQKSPELNEQMEKYKNDYDKYTQNIFDNSILVSEEKVNEFLDNPSLKVLNKDPGMQLSEIIITWFYVGARGLLSEAKTLKEKADRLYVAGLREMNPEIAYCPDANSTMRVTYGNVLAYDPQDAVHYDHFTTLAGVIEKEDPTSLEFQVPQKLKELYNAKDYGDYKDNDGKMHTCFISNNDITGGNSGSPVINGKGELIGTAFDGNWEAMSGDIAFEDKLQRTISVDIRYTLFIIDKFAGAGHLVKEMDLVYDVKKETEKTTK